jgi:hypothetical protein
MACSGRDVDCRRTPLLQRPALVQHWTSCWRTQRVLQVLFGTPFEFGYAFGLHKLIVAVGEPRVVAHPFIACSSVCFSDLEEALAFICQHP